MIETLFYYGLSLLTISEKEFKFMFFYSSIHSETEPIQLIIVMHPVTKQCSVYCAFYHSFVLTIAQTINKLLKKNKINRSHLPLKYF